MPPDRRTRGVPLCKCTCWTGSHDSFVFPAQLLKYAINEARPSGRKPDPGMPSAHGNSLGFLATFVSLAAAASLGIHSTAGLALVIGVPSVGIFLVRLYTNSQRAAGAAALAVGS